jgi:O-antigen/teichoic acid export membrane protein
MAKRKQDRSSLVVSLTLLVGLAAQAFGGPLAGIIGAAVAATAGTLAVRFYDHHRTLPSRIS